MIISLSGIQGSGKTTLLKDLQKTVEFKDWHFESEIVRSIKNLGLPINEQTNDLSQMLIEAKHLQNAFIPGNTVTDRCSLDSLCYAAYLHEHNQISFWALESSQKIFEMVKDRYDKIFITLPEAPPEEDGVRSLGGSFYNDIPLIFDFYIKEYNLDVVYLKGTRQERVNKVIEETFSKQYESSNSRKSRF